ncbi:MAG: hypothetical protein ACREQA_22285 [Candidatus Binatia bacterium]
MAAGDASRTWFSEMVETRRREWKPDIPWEEIIALRDRLDAMLQQIRLSRGIRPPTMWCPVCQRQTQQAPPSVSVRAVIFALGRFGIVPQVEVKSLEKRWAKHRKENGLDRNGRPACQGAGTPSEIITTPSSDARPALHSHDPTDGTWVASAGEHDGQEDEAVGEGITHDAAGRRPR